MIIQIFRSSYQSQIVFILLLTALLWFTGFLQPAVLPEMVAESPFVSFYEELQNGWLMTSLGLVLLFIQAAVLVSATGNFKILGLTNLLPILIYVIFMSFSKDFLTLHPFLLSNFFVLPFIHQLLANQGKHEALLEWFNVSLLVGIAVLIHPGNIVLLALLWITLITYRIYKIREWIISVLGIGVVFSFYAVYLYWKNELATGFDFLINYLTHIPAPLPTSLPVSYWAFLGVFVFLMLITVPRMIFKLDENIIPTRKRLNVVIFHALLLLAASLLHAQQWTFFLFQLFIPVSFTVSRLLTNIRKEKIKDWILVALLVSIVYERLINLVL